MAMATTQAPPRNSAQAETQAQAPAQRQASAPKAIDKDEPIKNNQRLAAFVGASKPLIDKILGSSMNYDKFWGRLQLAFVRNPSLFNCTAISVFDSACKAVQFDLEFSGATGEAFLVPYGNTCQFQSGYKGKIKVARRSGMLIQAEVVYENDEFSVELGLDRKIVHKPAMKERGEMVAAYAIARTAEGEATFEVMTAEDIQKIKQAVVKRAKGKQTPWTGDYEDQMWRKTPINRLCKYIPISDEMRELEIAEVEPEDAEVDAAKTDGGLELPAVRTRGRRVVTGPVAEHAPSDDSPVSNDEPNGADDSGPGAIDRFYNANIKRVIEAGITASEFDRFIESKGDDQDALDEMIAARRK